MCIYYFYYCLYLFLMLAKNLGQLPKMCTKRGRGVGFAKYKDNDGGIR